jgi:hypothetical protein
MKSQISEVKSLVCQKIEYVINYDLFLAKKERSSNVNE